MKNVLLLCITMILPCLAATKAEHALRSRGEIQLLWQTTGALTREYLVAKTLDLPNTKQIEKHLLKNTKAIAELVEPLYGEDTAKKLAKLLKEQAELTIETIDEAVKKDTKDRAKAEKNWQNNARELSTFLDKINPYLTYEKLYPQFLAYQCSLATMVTHRVAKKWDDDLADYDAVRTQLHTIVSEIGKALTDAFPLPKEKVAPPQPKVTVPLPPGTSLIRAV